MIKGILAVALSISAPAFASDWKPLPGYEKYFWIDVSTIQEGLLPGARQRVPTLGVWLKTEGEKFELWVECKGRTASTYTPRAITELGTYTAWAPIPPDTMEWAVWQLICKNPS